jgi:predicted RNA-binding protein YlxR (DUF448 family)
MKPIRSCIVCKAKKEKSSLIRVVANEEGKAILDTNQKENARAIYFCKNTICLKKFITLIEKNKVKIRISIEINSLKELLNKIIIELGE